MASTFRKDKLEETINALGIDVDENIEWNNEKMVKCLGDYYMSLEPEKYTWGARYIQSLNTVMLCKHLKEELKKFGDDNPAESPNYTAEVKLNGFRALLSYSPKDGFEFFSRNESISNYLNGNFTNKYLMFNKGIITEPKDYIGRFDYRFVLDGELLVERADGANVVEGVSVEDYIQSILGSSEERAKSFQKEECKLLFNVFDILYFEPHPNPNPPMPQYNYYEPEFTPELVEWVEAHYSDYLEEAHFEKGGKKSKILYQYLYTLKGTSKYDIRRLPFIKRRELRHKIVSFLQKEGVPFKEIEWEDTYKVAFTDNILREGGEGAILKAIHAPYISALRTNRGHRAAMKVKQNIASMLSGDMGEVSDFDVFITGANPPKSDRITDMIGALRCSIYIKEEDGTTHEHEIACVSGIPHEWKRKLAQIDVNTGKIGLNPEYLGKVIPINGLALTKGNLKFQHATLLNKGEMGFKAKHPTECTWDRSVLDDMVLVRGK